MSNVLPTSDLETFKSQLKSPNTKFYYVKQVLPKSTPQDQQLSRIKKHIVLAYNSDYTGCGHIRTIFPLNYVNSVFGKEGKMNAIISPFMIFQPDILTRTRSILFQRTMGPESVKAVKHYKDLQQQYKFKMVYDIDDFIWDGDEEGEEIPSYNFGKTNITKEVQDSAIENMKLMDTVCVSSPFLKDYIAKKGVDRQKIEVVHNTLPQYFWGTDKKEPITEKIKKPRVLWSASPTHWNNPERLAGDMDNAWKDWVIKAVNEDRIEYIQMGGLPWFFEEIKDKIQVLNWVPSYHYHLAIKDVKADFGISPLVPNFFNYSKSAIKYQEYCVSGIVGIGTVFNNGNMSPYDICQVKAQDNITVEEIDTLFDKLTEPDAYNNVLNAQYQQVVDENWITESAGYINKLTKIL